MLDAALCEGVDLFSRNRRSYRLNPALHCNAFPRVWYVLGELIGEEPAHNAPGFPAQPDHLLTGAQSLAVGAGYELVIQLVGRPRRDAFHQPVANAIALS